MSRAVARRPSAVLPILVALSAIGGCTRSMPVSSPAGYVVDPSSSAMGSWNAQRTERVIMQRLDYSCGAAALATLLSYYFDDPVSERDVLGDVARLFEADERAVIARDGLSFAELGAIARERGYVSAAVSLEPAALGRLGGPVVVYLRGRRFNHFAVLREVDGGRVRLADPSRGNVTMAIERFLAVWKGEALVLGRDGFGTPDDHRLRVVAGTLGPPVLLDARAPRLSPWIRVPR